jgi:hypothetical protein
MLKNFAKKSYQLWRSAAAAYFAPEIRTLSTALIDAL